MNTPERELKNLFDTVDLKKDARVRQGMKYGLVFFLFWVVMIAMLARL